MRMHRSVATLAVIAGFGACGLPALARADGPYIGVDGATMWTDVDWGGGVDHYTTQHLRLKGGYDFPGNFGFEMRIATGGDDTFNDFYGTWKWTAGTRVSGYFKPRVSFGNFDLYGLFGLSLMDTSYELVGFARDSESVLTFDFGFGGQINLTRNFGLTADLLYSVGSASYPTLTTGVYIDSTVLGAGVVFRF
jgi:Outer membrane protein beta-barrel domain